MVVGGHRRAPNGEYALDTQTDARNALMLAPRPVCLFRAPGREDESESEGGGDEAERKQKNRKKKILFS
jgi:hypothetical protein